MIPTTSKRKLFFRIWGVHEYNCVRNALLRAGFRRTEGDEWNFAWAKHLSPDVVVRLTPFQKCNHWPGSWAIGRKDRLSRNVDRLARTHGDA